jgi:TonB family protein
MWRRMSKVTTFRVSAALFASLATSPVLLAAGTSAPPIPMPPVAKQLCTDKVIPPGFFPATLANRVSPEFPEADAAEEREGWVRLGFTIDTAGETKDLVVLDYVGSQNMVRAARLAVKRWTYKPATEQSQPVEQFANTAEILFRDNRIGNAAVHDAVVVKFDEGRALISEGKYAEGIKLLEQTFEQPLTLFERARISFALAYAYERSKDMPRALVHIRHALIEKGKFLEKAVQPAAQRLRLRVEVATGNFHFAACAPPLPESDKFDPTGADRKETVKVIEDALTTLASSEPLTVRASLIASAADDEGGMWEHPLSRRKFKFASLVGQIQEYRLNCVRQVSSGAVDMTTQVSVPPSAGACVLRVYGEVGAAFRLIEEW